MVAIWSYFLYHFSRFLDDRYGKGDWVLMTIQTSIIYGSRRPCIIWCGLFSDFFPRLPLSLHLCLLTLEMIQRQQQGNQQAVIRFENAKNKR